MVETYVCNEAYVRQDDVRAVQPSSEPYFDDGYIHCLVGKVAKGHGGGQFKEGRMQRLEEATLFFHKTDDIFFRYGHPVDADTFTEIH